jgi:hypothetical protein
MSDAISRTFQHLGQMWLGEFLIGRKEAVCGDIFPVTTRWRLRYSCLSDPKRGPLYGSLLGTSDLTKVSVEQLCKSLDGATVEA